MHKHFSGGYTPLKGEGKGPSGREIRMGREGREERDWRGEEGRVVPLPRLNPDYATGIASFSPFLQAL